MLSKIMTIGKNAVKRRNFGVMAEKVKLRLVEKDVSQQARNWCASQVRDYKVFLQNIDKALWDETASACKEIETKGTQKIKTLNLDLGGAGHLPVLYFLTRYLKARTVLETGVAAGWSSQTFLSAVKENKNGGKLYSSDFPYFRYDNPEQYVGFVVEDDLKANWTLKIDGDKNNIPLLLGDVKASGRTIDIFHYDSDKSYNGRTYAWEQVKPYLADNATVIFDDIQDNLHFHDLVKGSRAPFAVFEYGGKYIGVLGSILSDA